MAPRSLDSGEGGGIHFCQRLRGKTITNMTLTGPEIARTLKLSAVTALGPRAWRGLTPAGEEAVLKTGPGAAPGAVELLRKLPHLFTPCRYPRVLAAEPGSYLLYAFISGEPLSRGEGGAAARAQVYELAGRLAAMFRSLSLVGMYRTMTGRGHERELAGEAAGGRRAILPTGLAADTGGLARRRSEAVQSYAWAQELMSRGRAALATEVPAGLWAALAARVEHTTSIHLSPGGSLLAHTAFTPEHVLACPDGELGVVSWQTAPRPYNYMRLRYLAWGLMHGGEPAGPGAYRELLAQVPAVSYTGAASLSLALALIETWLEAGAAMAHGGAPREALAGFLEDALEAGAEEQL